MEEHDEEVNDESELSEENELDLIKSLEQAIRENLNTLKSDIRSSLDRSKEIKRNSTQQEQKQTQELTRKTEESFLDFFGDFPTISPRIFNKFSIDTNNFKYSIEPFLNQIELESLYYYISIYKIMGEAIHLDIEKVISILEKYVSNGLFVSKKTQIPEPKSCFYGLSIISELNYESIQIIDMEKVRNFLTVEIDQFSAEKLHLNYYLLNSIHIFNKEFTEIEYSNTDLFGTLINIDLVKLEEYDPIIDLYDLFSCFKLLEGENNYSIAKNKYLDSTKDLLGKINPQELTITQCAKILLIIDLLDMKNDEKELISRLLDMILNSTQIFDPDVEGTDFSWKEDQLAWLIELRMLYWALLASFQYYSFI
ncbi:MAG: hypothetical protein GF311_21945 [Candidatus Lokiarchaeota archaeon]|nr:hypothetical protein [Candidatus Lokiarchaeota archaeon]